MPPGPRGLEISSPGLAPPPAKASLGQNPASPSLALLAHNSLDSGRSNLAPSLKQLPSMQISCPVSPQPKHAHYKARAHAISEKTSCSRSHKIPFLSPSLWCNQRQPCLEVSCGCLQCSGHICDGRSLKDKVRVFSCLVPWTSLYSLYRREKARKKEVFWAELCPPESC